jgi:DDE superfamily endonuclease
MSAILQKLISLSESEAASDSKKALKRRRDDEDFILQTYCTNFLRPCREEKFFRTRWREGSLRNLAENENSFIAEYRRDPVSFDLLSEMIEPDLDVNASMAKISTKSAPITIHSRLGAALIILAGGRRMEAMRTHGVSQSFTYANLRSVVRAINKNPNLKIGCDSSMSGLRTAAANFNKLGDHDLFKYCVGAIYGLAIRTRTPNRNSYKNTARFTSGSKKMICINMQGVCQSDLRFIAVTCKHVGCTNDAIAFETSSLKTVCKSLTFPYHWVGDNAYTSSCMFHLSSTLRYLSLRQHGQLHLSTQLSFRVSGDQ